MLLECENETARAVAVYSPKTQGRIDDLTAPAVDILRGLPGVVRVEVAQVANPTRRIIHLRDWHYVPKDLFTLDLNDLHGRTLTAEELDRRYRESLLEVEVVQLEQMAMLRCLIKHHGLREVHAEGFSPRIELYRADCRLRAIEQRRFDMFARNWTNFAL